MQPYKNLGSFSWISAFEAGDDYIKIEYIDGAIHLYNNNSVGSTHLTKMKELAVSGSGLHSYIIHHVKNMYETVSDNEEPR